jgi:hypothetical protein
MNCYSGDRGIVDVRVHESFKLRSLAGLFIGVGGTSSSRNKAGHGRRHAKLFFGEADVETANGSGEAYL